MIHNSVRTAELALGSILVIGWIVSAVVEHKRSDVRVAAIAREIEGVHSELLAETGSAVDPASRPDEWSAAIRTILDADRRWNELQTAMLYLGVVLLIAGALRLVGAQTSTLVIVYSLATLPVAITLVAGVMLLGVGGPLHSLKLTSVTLVTFFVVWPILIALYCLAILGLRRKAPFSKHAHSSPSTQ